MDIKHEIYTENLSDNEELPHKCVVILGTKLICFCVVITLPGNRIGGGTAPDGPVQSPATNNTEFYHYISVQIWTFSETSLGLAAVIASYLLLTLRILPLFMRNRQPYKLNRLLTFYNAFQVAFSLYAVFLYTRYIINHGIITTRCPKGEDLQQVIAEIWPYFIAKHVDLLDTVFFVLRKKDNQVTFLHVFHHTLMVTWTWYHLMYHPSDHFVVVGLINSFVHVLMYAYYGLASLGPEYSKFVWWKKHLTKVQLAQFILVLSNLHYQQKLTPCPIPSFFHYFCLFSISSFFFLFMNFYLRSYGAKKNLVKTENKPKNFSFEINETKVE